MSTTHREKLKEIRTFPSLIKYLRDDMNWPIEGDSFEEITFDYTPEELGIDFKNAVKIEEIKRLRPLSTKQPWGIFFVKFAPGPLPVVALRRILSRVALKKRASANSSERAAWKTDDLLFISNYGEGSERHITFAHFSQDSAKNDLPTLKVLGWDNLDTPLHLDSVSDQLTHTLSWPNNSEDIDGWRKTWSSAFLLRHREVIQTSENLSIQLAHLARAIRDRITSALAIENKSGPLTKLMEAFKEALVHDLDKPGFADMYAQTIAYGLLSARIANPAGATADELATQMPVTNPFLKELMETFLQVGGRKKKDGPNIDFDELGVSEVVDLLDDANMDAVIRDFGDKNPQEDPVIHFYELFLKEYDAKKRTQRGVFYTPRPVVSYIVRSLDELLTKSFNLKDGLADTSSWAEVTKQNPHIKIPKGIDPTQSFVQILDPATGTGTFLVEVIENIYRTVTSKWEKQGHSEDARVVLWNEYVPQHLLPRLHGYELLMAPYAIAHLKIGLKLFETGYKFASKARANIYLTNSLEPASDLASEKAATLFAALGHESQAVNKIKQNTHFTVIIGNPPYSAISANLTPENRKIVDRYRSVDGVPIREKSMLQFEKNIQDDYIKFFAFSQSLIEGSEVGALGFVTNHSYVDGITLRGVRNSLVNSFDELRVLDLHGNMIKKETSVQGDQNVFDIQQGVAIFLACRTQATSQKKYYLGHLRGPRDTKYQFLTSHSVTSSSYTEIFPEKENYLFAAFDAKTSSEYKDFAALTTVLAKNLTGTTTGFDDLLIDYSREGLIKKIEEFGNPKIQDKVLAEHYNIKNGHALFVLNQRNTLCAGDWKKHIQKFQLFPFDFRWAFLRKDLLQGHRFDVMTNLAPDKPGLVSMRQTKEDFGVFAVNAFCGHKLLGSYDRSYVFPLHDLDSLGQSFLNSFSLLENLSTPEKQEVSETLLFDYIYAILHSQEYKRRYGDFLRVDFPRVPKPKSIRFLKEISGIGSKLLSLHLMQDTESIEDTYIGPEKAEIEKVTFKDSTIWLNKKLTYGFGKVSDSIWNHKIGGYQVCEKWLKEHVGQKLSTDDIKHFQRVLCIIDRSIQILPEIDRVVVKHGGWPGAFK